MKNNRFSTWAKERRTELLITGGMIITAVGVVVLADNWDKIHPLLFCTSKPIAASNLPSLNTGNGIPDISLTGNTTVLKTFDVREHLRTLPQGHHPSAWKIAEAAAAGITLENNQTLVSAHPRCYAA